MTRKEIEQQADLARKLNLEPVRPCALCASPLRGLEKLGSVCGRCISERAAAGDRHQIEVNRSAFFNALIALAEPSEEDITIAHEYWHVSL